MVSLRSRRHTHSETWWIAMLCFALAVLPAPTLGQEKGSSDGAELESWRESLAGHSARARWWLSMRGADSTDINPAYLAWQEYQKLLGSGTTNRKRGRKSRKRFAWQSLGPRRIQTGRQPWNKISGHGRVNCLAFDPQDPKTIYAGSAAGGLWKTTNGARTWRRLAKNHSLLLSISGIAVDPEDSRTLYVLTGDGEASTTTVAPVMPSVGVLKSIDGGETWELTGLTWTKSARHYGFDLEIDPNRPQVLFAVTDEGLYRSADGAKSWSLVLKGQARDLALQPGDATTAYVSTTESVYKSTDNGKTWKVAFTPKWSSASGVGYRRIGLAVTPADSDVVYAVAAQWNDFIGVYRSLDGGETFQRRSPSLNLAGWYCDGKIDPDNRATRLTLSYFALTIAVSPADAEDVWVGSVNVWRSKDGGKRWEIRGYYNNCQDVTCREKDQIKCQGKPFLHADNHALYIREALSGDDVGRCPAGGDRSRFDVFSANDGGVYKTENDGARWCSLSDGLSITQVYQLCALARDSGVYYGAQDNGTNYLRNGVAHAVYRGDGAECSVHGRKSPRLFVSRSGGQKIRWFPDETSIVTLLRTKQDEKCPWITPFEIHAAKRSSVYTCCRNVYRLGDLYPDRERSENWTRLNTEDLGGGRCQQIKIARSDPDLLYLAKSKSVYVSEDGGKEWEELDVGRSAGSATAPSITNLTVSGRNPDRFWITLGGYVEGEKVYERSVVGGVSRWRNLSGSLPNVPVFVLLQDRRGCKNRIYVGTEVGVFYRKAKCGDRCDWVYMEGLPPISVLDLMIQNGHLLAATFGQGVFQTPLKPLR